MSLTVDESGALSLMQSGWSAAGRPALDDVDRQQLVLLDSVRSGTRGDAADAASPDDRLWKVNWATGADLDDRLRLKLHVGHVIAAAWGTLNDRPLIATCIREDGNGGGEPRYCLQIWDALAVQSRVVPSVSRVRCMSFAVIGAEPWLVTGHDHGWLRVWRLADLSLRSEVKVGDDHMKDMHVPESVDRPLVVTLDERGSLQRRSLPSCALIGTLRATRTSCMYAGQLADGRPVLLTGGAELSVWDWAHDSPIRRLQIPAGLTRIVSVALTTAYGRTLAAVVDQYKKIYITDIDAAGQVNGCISAHVNGPESLMQVRGSPQPHAKLAALSGTLAVPTRFRVHLWDLNTSRPGPPAIGGPVAESAVRAVRWNDRELLLTSSAEDGVVALWDLERSTTTVVVQAERVSRVAVATPTKIVISVDAGGTIAARDGADGRIVAGPMATGIENIQALAAWHRGPAIIVATGAGSRETIDGHLRRWNVTIGAPDGAPIDAHRGYLHWMSRFALHGDEVLVTLGPDHMLRVWRLADGHMITEISSGVMSKVTGFATGMMGGQVVAALSSVSQPLTLHTLDDPATPPMTIPEAGHDAVLDIVGSHIIAATPRNHHELGDSIRAWNQSGSQAGPAVRGVAAVVSAVGRKWPEVYVGRADDTVTLVDVLAGRNRCRPMLMPAKPTSLAVLEGDLIVGFGRDLARVAPPVG